MQTGYAYRIILIRYLSCSTDYDRFFNIIGISDKDRALINLRDLTERTVQIHVRGSSGADYDAYIENYKYPEEYSYGYDRLFEYA